MIVTKRIENDISRPCVNDELYGDAPLVRPLRHKVQGIFNQPAAVYEHLDSDAYDEPLTPLQQKTIATEGYLEKIEQADDAGDSSPQRNQLVKRLHEYLQEMQLAPKR